jgi:glycosyltransferase involved in cell wall biosynthesis
MRHVHRLDIVLGLPLLARGPAYTCALIANAMHGDQLHCVLHAPADGWQGPSLDLAVRPVVGNRWPWGRRVAWRGARTVLMSRLEHQLMQALESTGDALVWTFGELPLSISRRLARHGATVVREKFNCAKATVRAILVAEHERMGFPPFDGITTEMIDKEGEELALASAVFCPSPEVKKSLLAVGVPDARLLPSSYGWAPARFARSGRALPPAAGPTLVFVGRLTPRKGIHFLLDAWAKAGIRGRLLLAGQMDSIIAQRYGHVLARDDVVHLGFVEDVGAVFRSADWLVFPSLEEGGPQVTYEAAACGLPALVTPMGAGAFTRHGVDGLVLDSVATDDWVDLIRSLPDRAAERDAMAASARARSREFTWDRVGARRREQLLTVFGACSAERRPL